MTVAEAKTDAYQPPILSEPDAPNLIEAWALRCIESGQPPSEVVTDAEINDLSSDDLLRFARIGAVASVNDWLHNERGRKVEDESAPQPRYGPPMHACRGRNPTLWRALGITLGGADGRLKALINFSADDLRSLAADAKLQRAAWTKRESWALTAEKALREHEAELLVDLPAEVLADLDARAEKAWKK